MDIKNKLYDECAKCKYASIVRNITTGKIMKIMCCAENDCSIAINWKTKEDALHNPIEKCPTYAERYLCNIYESDKK